MALYTEADEGVEMVRVDCGSQESVNVIVFIALVVLLPAVD